MRGKLLLVLRITSPGTFELDSIKGEGAITQTRWGIVTIHQGHMRTVEAWLGAYLEEHAPVGDLRSCRQNPCYRCRQPQTPCRAGDVMRILSGCGVSCPNATSSRPLSGSRVLLRKQRSLWQVPQDVGSSPACRSSERSRERASYHVSFVPPLSGRALAQPFAGRASYSGGSAVCAASSTGIGALSQRPPCTASYGRLFGCLSASSLSGFLPPRSCFSQPTLLRARASRPILVSGVSGTGAPPALYHLMQGFGAGAGKPDPSLLVGPDPPEGVEADAAWEDFWQTLDFMRLQFRASFEKLLQRLALPSIAQRCRILGGDATLERFGSIDWNSMSPTMRT